MEGARAKKTKSAPRPRWTLYNFTSPLPLAPLGGLGAGLREAQYEWPHTKPRTALIRPVVLHAQVGDLLFAHQPAQGVLQLGLLYEKVVLRVD